MEIELAEKSKLAINVNGINPDVVCKLSIDDVRRLPIEVGVATVELGEVFDVAGNSEDASIRWLGELVRVNFIGAGMNGGSISVESSIGSFAGQGMRSGELTVHGDAGDFMGAEMTSGTIQVEGDCGDGVGGVLPGGNRGMNGGTILIDGSVGQFAGQRMRRGTLVVRGDAGNYFGYQMLAGTLVSMGEVQRPVGLDMTRGTIVCESSRCVEGQKTEIHFSESCSGGFVALRLIRKHLKALNFKCDEFGLGEYRLSSGDLSNEGRGELFNRY